MTVSQEDQIRISTWFTSVFFMNRTELRSFSHFQILTKNAYPGLSRNLQIDKFWSLYSFTVKLWKSVKIIKFICKLDLQVLSWWMEQYQEVLVIFKFWPESQKLENWLILEPFFNHCKSVKVSQNDQLRI